MTPFRIPISDKKLLKLCILALQMEPRTPVEKVKGEDNKVCSVHFDPDDFYPGTPEPAPAKRGERVNRKQNPMRF